MFKYGWALLFLAVFGCVLADDQPQAAVCQYVDGLYQFSFTGDVTDWAFQDGYDYNLTAMTARGDGVRFTIFADSMSISVFGYPDVPHCPEDQDVWHPGAPSIPIELNSDCAFIETKDYLNGVWTGNWSRVQSNGKDVLLHYGQALIGSANQSVDPADYRAVETECF